MPYRKTGIVLGTVVLGCVTAISVASQEWKSGVDWPEPAIITPGEGTAPPSDAIVLFDGGDLEAWNGVRNWTFEDDYAIVGSTIRTKQKFGDCQLHLEFATPQEVEGSGQGRGNSGVYLMGRYEVQVLDSYDNTTYYDGQCAAIYKQNPPLVNCSREPGQWQSYDIIFTAPRFHADGSLKSPAYVTVLHNGVLVQNHYQIQGPTEYVNPPQYKPHPLRDSISLQFHGDAVRFRNIWIRDLMAETGSAEIASTDPPEAAESAEGESAKDEDEADSGQPAAGNNTPADDTDANDDGKEKS